MTDLASAVVLAVSLASVSGCVSFANYLGEVRVGWCLEVWHLASGDSCKGFTPRLNTWELFTFARASVLCVMGLVNEALVDR